VIYLDSNVFIYASTDDGSQGKAAAKVLTKALRDGACTASLTADEVLWAVTKKLGRTLASEKVRQMLELDLEVLAVEKKDVEAALTHFDGGLDPRDAIHAAVALRAGCTSVVSTDSAFAKVKGLRHTAY
jgi:predicted nucleic acid-binding protein